MLSEERCVDEHCRACENYYRDMHGGVCVKNIKCKNFIETKKSRAEITGRTHKDCRYADFRY